MQTNFDSMIAHYQTVPNKNATVSKLGKAKFDQAKMYKNILEQPIGKMWFPSLGGAIATASNLMLEPASLDAGRQKIALKGVLAGVERSRSQNATR